MNDVEFTPENVTPEMIWLAAHLIEMRRIQDKFYQNPSPELFTERHLKEVEIDKSLQKIMSIANLELVDG